MKTSQMGTQPKKRVKPKKNSQYFSVYGLGYRLKIKDIKYYVYSTSMLVYCKYLPSGIYYCIHVFVDPGDF